MNLRYKVRGLNCSKFYDVNCVSSVCCYRYWSIFLPEGRYKKDWSLFLPEGRYKKEWFGLCYYRDIITNRPSGFIADLEVEL